MKNPLLKRLPRELIGDIGKYLAVFLFMTATIGFVSGFLVADDSMLAAYQESFEKYHIEDGNFTLEKKATDSQIKRLEKEGVQIYENYYVEEDADTDLDGEKDSTVRVYKNRSQIDLVCLMKGELPKKEDEIAIDRMYAENNKIQISDIIKVGKEEKTVTGYVALSDYSALFSNNSDMMFDAVKFGVAIVTDEAFEKLLAWSAVNIPALRREFVEPALQKFIGYIPMGPYLEFYYDYDTNFNDLQNYSGNHWEMMVEHVRKHVGDVLDDLQAPEHATRAECVKIIEKRTFELYEKLDPRAYQLACNTRGGKGYGEAGITLMNAMWNNTNEVFSPDVASMGCIQEFDPHCVCTTTSLVNASGIHPMCFAKLPGHMMSKIYAAKEYEKLAVEAAVTGSYHAALEALVANPLVNSYYKAKSALNELLVAEKEWLPNFADAIAALEKGEEPNN